MTPNQLKFVQQSHLREQVILQLCESPCISDLSSVQKYVDNNFQQENLSQPPPPLPLPLLQLPATLWQLPLPPLLPPQLPPPPQFPPQWGHIIYGKVAVSICFCNHLSKFCCNILYIIETTRCVDWYYKVRV